MPCSRTILFHGALWALQHLPVLCDTNITRARFLSAPPGFPARYRMISPPSHRALQHQHCSHSLGFPLGAMLLPPWRDPSCSRPLSAGLRIRFIFPGPSRSTPFHLLRALPPALSFIPFPTARTNTSEGRTRCRQFALGPAPLLPTAPNQTAGNSSRGKSPLLPRPPALCFLALAGCSRSWCLLQANHMWRGNGTMSLNQQQPGLCLGGVIQGCKMAFQTHTAAARSKESLELVWVGRFCSICTGIPVGRGGQEPGDFGRSWMLCAWRLLCAWGRREQPGSGTGRRRNRISPS